MSKIIRIITDIVPSAFRPKQLLFKGPTDINFCSEKKQQQIVDIAIAATAAQ
ncbi:MAG TPA: hypothetical protein VEG30_00955 [Terriglobales bacterium]|nr:hypothetical protein [Terriglobales bacterium]